MNTYTTQTESKPETPTLKTRCNRGGIRVPFADPTPPQIIPYVEQHLASHMKDPARRSNPWTGDYAEWKFIHDDLQAFLTELREAAQSQISNLKSPSIEPSPKAKADAIPSDPPKNIFTDNPCLSGSTVANQQTPARSEAGPRLVEAGSAGSGPASSRSDQPKTTTSTESTKSDPLEPADENEHHESEEETDDDFNIEDYLDDESIEASLDLQSHLSGKSPLDKLTSRQQQAILKLLEDYPAWRVLEVLRQPRPHGLDIQTSKTALNDFRNRLTRAKEKCTEEQNQKAIETLLVAANSDDESFQTAVQRLLKTRLLTATSEPNSSLPAINSLINGLTKLRKQVLAERKQLHAESK